MPIITIEEHLTSPWEDIGFGFVCKKICLIYTLKVYIEFTFLISFLLEVRTSLCKYFNCLKNLKCYINLKYVHNLKMLGKER